MRAHQGAHVERLEAVEQAVPDDGDDARRAEQHRKAHQGVVGKLAALVGTAHQAAQRLEQTFEHLAIVELGERRKPRSFADHQPDNLAAARAVDLAHENFDRLVNDRAQRQFGSKGKLQRADYGHHFRTDQFLKQALLVGEVQIDGALGDAGAFGDIVEPRRGKAFGGEFIEGRVEDGVAARRGFGGARALARCGDGAGTGWPWRAMGTERNRGRSGHLRR